MRNPVTETQVVIIGAGIIGAAVAREFSKYEPLLIETRFLEAF